MSIRFRIILGFSILLVSSLSIVIYLVLSDVRPRYLEAVEETTVDIAQVLAASIAEDSKGDKISISKTKSLMELLSTQRYQAKIYSHTKDRTDLRVYITDSSGILIYDSSNEDPLGTDYSKWNDVFLTLKGRYGARSSRKIADDPSSSTLYVAAPVVKQGRVIGVVSVGKLKNNISFFIEIAKQKFVFISIVVVFSAIGLGFLLSYWISEPIKKLINYSQRVSRGESVTQPDLGTSDLKRLGDSIIEMKNKLEGKEYVENYIQNLTHELKSPLTGIKGAAELLKEDLPEEKRDLFTGNIIIEANRLHDFADRLLELSKIERLESIQKDEEFYVGKLLSQLIDSFLPQTEKKKIKMILRCNDNIVFSGNKFLIKQAVNNLIQNAISFSPENSEIIVSVKDERNLIIKVKDCGQGIPDYAISKVFDKFYSLERPNGGKKSTGLGLTFTKEVVELHHGTISLENLNGLTVTLCFPKTISTEFSH